MSVCFVVGAIVKTLQVSAFTLVWTHSVQKTDWQEDWRVSPDGLLLTGARVKGSGAGIDPPAEARLVDGWWRWRPQAVARSEVILSQSSAAGDWRICANGRCRTLADILGPAAASAPVAMRSCAANR
jgi:hypothetical protein